MDIIPSEESIAADIWERTEDETTKAYGAFTVYRNLPPHERSLRQAVVEMYGEVQQGKLRQLQKWSSKFSWVLRAQAWDDELDRQARADLIQQVKDANNRHIKLSQALQQTAIERLKTIQPIELSVKDVLDWIIQGAKIERLTLGEPEEIKQVQGELGLIDYSRMSTDELNVLMSRKLAISPSVPLPIDIEEEEEEEEDTID